MNGLLDIFGTSGTDTLGLLGMSPEAIKRSRDDAQAQALYSLAGSLLSGGPTGLSIVRGLQQGSQAYKNAMQGQLQEQFQGFQLQDAMRKRKLEEEALKRQQMIDRAVVGSFQPAQAAAPAQFYGQETQMPVMDDEGNLMPGATAPVAGRAAGLDLQSLAPLLMATPQGRKTLSELVTAQKAMRPELVKVGENERVFEIDPLTGARTQVADAQPKQNLTTDYNNWVLAGKPGTFQSWLSESKKPLVVMNQGQKGFENTTDLKKQFGGEPIYKEFAGMDTAYKQVTSAIKENSPIGDTAAATKIMKLLDPGSVVRETELGMAMAATGKMDRLKNYMDLYISGRKLTDSQRTEFQSLANQLYNAAAVAYNEKRGEYEQIGKGFNLNTDLALGKPAKVMQGMPSGDLASQAAAELKRRRGETK
jgi:hypothetical protein